MEIAVFHGEKCKKVRNKVVKENKMKTQLEKHIVKWAYSYSEDMANSTCKFFFGQPVLPEKVKKLTKF